MMAPALFLLACAATVYLAMGMVWTICVAAERLLADLRITVPGVLGQWLLWPLAVWLAWQDRERGE